MHRTKYGILLQDITDLQLTILLDTGSTAAKQVIQKDILESLLKDLS